MSYGQYESSAYAGTPERLFLFQMGTTRWAYVNSDSSTLYQSTVYEPLMIEMGGLAQALSEDSPTMEIRMDASAALPKQFIPYQPIFPVRVRVFRHHVEDPDGQYVAEFIGEVINVVFDESEGVATVNVRMFASNLDRRVPWPSYQKPCNHALYGPGCRIDRDLYATETNIDGVDADVITDSAFGAKAAAEGDPRWYVNGYVTRVSTGETRFVIGQDGSSLYLQAPFVGLQTGDLVRAYAGCDRLEDTCRDKFDNLHRFLGFNNIPEKNPFVDNIYGNGTASGGGGSASYTTTGASVGSGN